jgi:hypothetical protein
MLTRNWDDSENCYYKYEKRSCVDGRRANSCRLNIPQTMYNAHYSSLRNANRPNSCNLNMPNTMGSAQQHLKCEGVQQNRAQHSTVIYLRQCTISTTMGSEKMKYSQIMQIKYRLSQTMCNSHRNGQQKLTLRFRYDKQINSHRFALLCQHSLCLTYVEGQ